MSFKNGEKVLLALEVVDKLLIKKWRYVRLGVTIANYPSRYLNVECVVSTNAH